MEDEVKDFQKQERTANFLSRISAVHIILFGIGVFIVIAISKSATDSRYTYLGFGVLIVIILVLLFKPTKRKDIIPEHLAKKLAYRALEKKRRDGMEFPFDSKIRMMAATQLIWKEDEITGQSTCVGRDIGFEVFMGSSINSKDWVLRLDAYTGDLKGMQEMPLGYTGKERTTNIKIVPVGVINTPEKSLKDFKV